MNQDFSLAAYILVGVFFCFSLRAEDGDSAASATSFVFPGGPQAVTVENFVALKSNSPFRRALDLSESLSLTGVARIEGNLFVTLLERETKKTRVVSSSADEEGWRLVEVGGNEAELETVTAQVAIAGGEIFSVRYQERQLKPETANASGRSGSSNGGGKPPVPERDFREGVSGDGFRGPPPPGIVKKLSQLRADDRNRIIQQIGEIRDRGVSSEQRQVIFVRMVDRALQQKR